MIALSAASVSVTTIRIQTPPPQPPAPPQQQGPGFDGLDADADGAVSLDEFRRAADGVRFGGAAGVGGATGAAASAGSVGGYGGQLDRLRSLDVGFDAASELERALAAIDRAAARPEESDTSIGAEAASDDPTALAAQLNAAVDVSGERYDDAVDDVFALADADRDGVMSRAEFDRVQAAVRADDLMRRNLALQEEIRAQLAEPAVLEAQVIEGYAMAQTATGVSAVAFQSVSLTLA